MKKINIRITTNGAATDAEIADALRATAEITKNVRAMSHFGTTVGDAHARITEKPARREIESITTRELANDFSGTLVANHIARHGYECVPITTMGEHEYAILHQPTLAAGRQTAEVLDITNFNHGSKFTVARSSDNYAFVAYGDDGWSVLTVYDGHLYEYTNPHSAVLTYRVGAPTRDDVLQTADEMDAQLQDNIDSGGSLDL